MSETARNGTGLSPPEERSAGLGAWGADLGTGQAGLVSIIIPTYRRPRELVTAVKSALCQTYTPVEVIVVSDGADTETRAAMEALQESLRARSSSKGSKGSSGCGGELRYFELPENRGPAEARNAGVRASRGEWLSFSDDDDEILPDKTARQMKLADSAHPKQMITCRTIYRHDGIDAVWPAQPLAEGEDVATYILRRPSLLGRPGVLPIQTLLVHRSIFAAVPFTTHRDHEDWAWLLEAWHRTGARVRFVWEPLVVYNIVTDSMSRSRRMNWADSAKWARDFRAWIPDRAYTSFLATKVALKARRAGDWGAVRTIAAEVLRNHPGPLELLFLLGALVVPGSVLHQAWRRSLGKQPSGALPGIKKGR